MKLSSVSVKILATSLLIASTTGLVFANGYKGEANYKGEAMPAPCPPPQMLKDGFYLGAQVGYDSYRVRQSVNTPLDSTLVTNPAIAINGWTGGLFLGYGQYLSSLFYLGGEIFGNVNGASQTYSISDASGSYSSKFETNGSYGLALLPGLKLNDSSLGYLRLGWKWANLKAQETLGGGAFASSKSNTSNGFNFGVGIDTLLVDNWSVRGDFSHTWFNSFTSSFGTKFNPSDNLFMLGLEYHFA